MICARTPLPHLGNQSAIVVLDETSFPKQGKKSAGVGVQYCGTTGQVENCQVGVFLSYVTARGHTRISRELYLPLDWTEDRERCQAAGIPASVRFQTKPELARRMLARLWDAQVPIAWVVADTVYGGNLDLRTWLESHQYSYVLAVPCNEPVGILTRDGQRRRVEVWEVEALLLGAQDWQRLSMSEGTKGKRLFDWASVPILHQWQDDGRHFLLIRRSLTDPNEKAYYFVFAPKGTTLPEMVAAIGARWHIEEDLENAKDLGLDHYEVRCFIGWYRHITLVLVALADFPGICATERFSPFPPAPSSLPARPAVLALTVPEVRHLLAQLIWPASSSACRVLAWSWWRRSHQSRASYYHTKRRRDLLANPGFFAIFHRWLLPIVFPPRLPGNFLEVSEVREISRTSGFSCLPLCLFSKGNSIMTPLSVADGARLLGIHPKTLCHWLKQANISLAAHPADARIKGVTQQDLHQLASLHGRPLQSSVLGDAVSPSSVPSQVQALSGPQKEREPASTSASFPRSYMHEADQIQRLASLETRMLALQEQIAQLTLALLKERERSVEHRLTALESRLQPLVGRQLSAPLTPEAEQEAPWTLQVPKPLHPAEQLARSRRPPLIEYCASGIYVIISSQEGEVHLEPNSRAWFDWLATLSSFRFIGPVGRFTAHRGYKQGQQTHFWSASRCVRRHTYKHYLGVTESLTIASLEHIAARLQSDIDAR